MYMKKISVLIIFALLFVVCFSAVSCAGNDMPPDLTAMELAFEDNFDGNSLDRSKWNYGFAVDEGKESSPRKGGFWARDGVFVEDGNLVLRTDWREDGENGAGWYSGAVMTCGEPGEKDNLFEQKYGYFEIKCKTPFFYGGWSAFWMMPYDHFDAEHSDQESPDHINTGVDGAEIDIFESPFSYLKNSEVVNHAVHYDGYRDYLKSVGKTGIKVNNLYNEYHTYALEWTEKYYKFFVDGKMTWKITSDGYRKDSKKIGHNIVSQVSEYMLLSFEVVSPDVDDNTVGWCGDPSLNDKNKNYDFVIDYVRVYQFK